MKQICDEVIEINFQDLNDLKLKFNKKIGLMIHWDDVKYEFILKLEKNSDELMVVGSAALGNKKKF